MAGKRANPNLIKLHRTYSVEEAALALKVHKNTVRGWLVKGLEPIDNQRPMLFAGTAMRDFLKKQRAARKRPCPAGTLYCLKCRQPRAPALGMADYKPFSTTSGNLKAMCEACGTMMHRRTSLASLKAVLPEIEVQIAQAERRIS